MKLRLEIITIFSALAVSFTSCFFLDDELPAQTQDGNNSFGMLLDGDVWEPSPFAGILGPNNRHAFHSNNQLYVTATKTSNSSGNQRIVLVVEGASSAGTYQVSSVDSRQIDPGCSDSTRFELNNNCSHSFFLTDGSSELEITRFDTIDGIVAGSFFLDLHSRTGERIEVREGRFDLKL